MSTKKDNDGMKTKICICGLGFETNVEYRVHQDVCERSRNISQSDESFICAHCSEKFSSEDLRKQHHIDVCHSDNGQEFICSLCDKVLKGEHFFHTHFESQHLFHCPLCAHSGWNFVPKLTFQQHMLSMHNITKVELKGMERIMAKIVITPCPTCGKQFHKRFKLINHFKQLGHGRIYECSRCNMYAVNASIHRYHERVHTSTLTEYNCELCNAQFANKRGLLFHIIQHDCPYRCSYCSEQSVHFAILGQHTATHNSSVAFYEDHCLNLKTKRRKLVAIDGEEVQDTWGAYKNPAYANFGTQPVKDNVVVLSDDDDDDEEDVDTKSTVKTTEESSEPKSSEPRNKRSRISACHNYICEICEKTFMSKKFFVSHMAWHSKGVSIKCQVLTPYFNVKEAVDFVPSDITITLNGKSPNFTIRHRHEGDAGTEQEQISLCDSGDEEVGETLYYNATSSDPDIKKRRLSTASQDDVETLGESMALGTAKVKSEEVSTAPVVDSTDEDEDSIMIVGSSQPRKRVKKTNNRNNKKKLLLCNNYMCMICLRSFVMKKLFVTHLGSHGQGKSIKCEVWTNYFNIKDKADFIPEGSYIALVLEPGTKDNYKVVLKQQDEDDDDEVIVAIDSDNEEESTAKNSDNPEVTLNSGFTPIINDENTAEDAAVCIESTVEYAEIPVIKNPYPGTAFDSNSSLAPMPGTAVGGASSQVPNTTHSSMSSSISLIQNATSILLDPGTMEGDIENVLNEHNVGLNPPVITQVISSNSPMITPVMSMSTGQAALDQPQVGSSDVTTNSLPPIGSFTSELAETGSLFTHFSQSTTSLTATTLTDTASVVPTSLVVSQALSDVSGPNTTTTQSAMQQSTVATPSVTVTEEESLLEALTIPLVPDNTTGISEVCAPSESLNTESVIDSSDIKQSPGAKERPTEAAESVASPLVIRQVRSLSTEGAEQLENPPMDEEQSGEVIGGSFEMNALYIDGQNAQQAVVNTDQSPSVISPPESMDITSELGPSDEQVALSRQNLNPPESSVQISRVESPANPGDAVFRIESIRTISPAESASKSLSPAPGGTISSGSLPLPSGVIFSETPAEEMTAEELESMPKVSEVVSSSENIQKVHSVPALVQVSAGSTANNATTAPPSEQITETLEILAEMGEIAPVSAQSSSAPQENGTEKGTIEDIAVPMAPEVMDDVL